ncbi:MAG: PAS domain S-box protein, partial [Gemmataceae bacterium]|nr:PAS domain S-box protein [Gemmataceae bacterium]
ALRSVPAGADWVGVGVGLAAVAAGWWAAVVLPRRLGPALDRVVRHARGEDLEQLRLLEAAVTASGDGVMVAEAGRADDQALQVAYANPAFERMMGYASQEAVGLSPSIFCHPSSTHEDAPDPTGGNEAAALRAIRAALRGSEPVRLELPSRRKDGSVVWAEWSVVPVADITGAFTHWVAVLRDTTERRRLEEQLREGQKLEALGRLAGGVAHDFNNLLTVIKGNADLLKEGIPDGPPPAELVDDIRGAADRAAGLVRQLLTFGRRQPVRPEVVDLNEVVRETVGMLRRVIGSKVQVAADLGPSAVLVRADRTQLVQVVMNLAVNARDAMPGGGKLTVTTRTPRDAATGARVARLTVADTGTGMPPEVRAKIFEPFFTTKGPGKGTGLGLATVYGIVKQSGGDIGVESTPGAGTTFRVDLPLCDDAANPAGSGSKSHPGLKTGAGRAAILAEDEAPVRRLARGALEAAGYAVAEAADGDAALELLAAGAGADLLVTDLAMPGVGGWELADKVRAARPDAGVVIVSGYVPDADRLGGLPGAVFVPKPFTPGDLVQAAAEALTWADEPAGV